MFKWMGSGFLAVYFALPCPAPACSLCSGNLQSVTLAQDAAQAKAVFFGTLDKPRLNGDGLGRTGTTQLLIEMVLKTDPLLGERKILEIPRFVPVDPKNPPKFMVFCDVYKDKNNKIIIDPYRGMPVKSAAAADYLRGALAIKDRGQGLNYRFKFLDHPDKEIADDAFLEFAKATDLEIGQVAGGLSPEKLRLWLRDEKTPANHLSLYGLLLGACGSDKDAVLLKGMLEKPSERTESAFDGLLGGYIHLRPREGWDFVHALLNDDKKPFIQRFCAIRTMRFYHGWKPEESRAEVMRGMRVVISKGDLADLAIDDLRRWQVWDLTAEVLATFGHKSHDAPIVRSQIVRYALCCPKPEAVRFVEEVRKMDKELVKDVEESLEFEKKKS